MQYSQPRKSFCIKENHIIVKFIRHHLILSISKIDINILFVDIKGVRGTQTVLDQTGGKTKEWRRCKNSRLPVQMLSCSCLSSVQKRAI